MADNEEKIIKILESIVQPTHASHKSMQLSPKAAENVREVATMFLQQGTVERMVVAEVM